MFEAFSIKISQLFSKERLSSVSLISKLCGTDIGRHFCLINFVNKKKKKKDYKLSPTLAKVKKCIDKCLKTIKIESVKDFRPEVFNFFQIQSSAS